MISTVYYKIILTKFKDKLILWSTKLLAYLKRKLEEKKEEN